MNIDEKKDYLKRFQILNRRIDQTQIEIAHWWDIGTRVTPQYTDMPKSSGTSNKVQTVAVEIAELEQQLEVQKREALAIRNQIKEILNSLQDDELRDLLWYYYICGLSWGEVADKMHYDLHYVYALHRKALEQLKIPKHHT